MGRLPPNARGRASPLPGRRPPRSRSLTNLHRLDLSGTQVADAAPLAHLTNLQRLSLSGTQVADAAPLARLTNLQDALPLRHPGRRCSPRSPSLTNLQGLSLIDTQVADAAPLARLTNLETLWLDGTQVADAAPLAGLTNLQSARPLQAPRSRSSRWTELKRALRGDGVIAAVVYRGP